TKDFVNSVDRASIIINDRAKSHIKCTFHPDFASVSCITSIGKVNDCFDIQTLEGDGFTIGFNNKYMLDALKATETDEIVLELNGPVAPIKIVPANSDHFLFLVLPVRLKND
ncbi:MAG: DNA polymerase III subunit beta, partial [Oscillospiraceae bacterium]|nr:DNA polymerase III subunit beta [Oscillospiraceae bacterium]